MTLSAAKTAQSEKKPKMMTKITCVSWDASTDTFHFEVREWPNELVAEPSITGSELYALGEKPLRECTTQEISIFSIYHKHFKEEPADMIDKSVTID